MAAGKRGEKRRRMASIRKDPRDSNPYRLKYFVRRRAGSVWSEKNKKIVEMLREKS